MDWKIEGLKISQSFNHPISQSFNSFNALHCPSAVSRGRCPETACPPRAAYPTLPTNVPGVPTAAETTSFAGSAWEDASVALRNAVATLPGPGRSPLKSHVDAAGHG